jgi:esterase/lipase
MKALFITCIVLLSNMELFSQNQFEFDQKTVQFENNGVQLSGVLVTPKTDEKVPLIIIVPNSWSSRSVQIAEFYAKKGIACFTYDSRDMNKKMGIDSYKDSIVEIYSRDLQIAINKVKGNKNFAKIGVLGISMGGWIIERAIINENVDFYIMVSTQTMSFKKAFEWQLESCIKNNVDSNRINSIKSQMKNVMYSHDFEFNPLGYIKEIKIPSIWIFGGNDINISVEQTVSDLETIKNSNKITIKTYEGLDHSKVFDNEMVQNDLINWMKKTAASSL